MIENKIKLTIVCVLSLILVLLMGNVSSATTVEVTTEKLSPRLEEGKQVDFTMQIKNYENVEQLVLETNLVPSSADKPLWNFGESEPAIDVNRYQQKIVLNLSSLPTILSVTVSGKVPSGVEKIKCGDIVLDNMRKTKLKFYEIRADDKLVSIESFDLVVASKEEFENTLQQIRRKEFDGLKTEAINVFNVGLTTEAQKMATEMSTINWPGNLKLFGILPVESNMSMNILVVLLILGCTTIGYILGSREYSGSDE